MADMVQDAWQRERKQGSGFTMQRVSKERPCGPGLVGREDPEVVLIMGDNGV